MTTTPLQLNQRKSQGFIKPLLLISIGLGLVVVFASAVMYVKDPSPTTTSNGVSTTDFMPVHHEVVRRDAGNVMQETPMGEVLGTTAQTYPADFIGPVPAQAKVLPPKSNTPTSTKGIKGDKGSKGDMGPQGIPGPQGPKGDKGDPGTPGSNGSTSVSVPNVSFVPGIGSLAGFTDLSAENFTTQKLNVSSNIIQTGGTTSLKDTTINGTLTLTNNVSSTGNLGISGNADITGNLGVTGSSTFTGTLTSNGQLIATKAPTLAHTFSPSWPTGTSNVADSSLYINPATATSDSNLIGAAVNGVPKFLVDAEGDIYGGNLILTGSTSAGSTNIGGNLAVQDNTTLGDAITDTITLNGRFNSDLLPLTDNTYNIGSTAKRWASLRVGTGDSSFAGNVGIGTTTPGQKLDVAGNGNFSGAGAHVDVQATDSNNQAYLRLLGNTGGSASSWIIASRGGLDTPNNRLGFYNNGNGEVLTVLNSGNVGIGTTNPTALLSLAGTMNWVTGLGAINQIVGPTDQNLNITNGLTGNTAALSLYGNQGSTFSGSVTIGTGNSGNGVGGPISIVSGTGNAGNTGGAISITAGQSGASGSAAAVTITGSAGRNVNSAPGGVVALVGGAGGNGGTTNGAGGNITIQGGAPGSGAGTASTYGNIVLNSSGGNVGIGTTTPASTLDVATSNNGVYSIRAYQAVAVNYSSNFLITATTFGGNGGLEVRDLNNVYGARGIRAGFGLFDGTATGAVPMTIKGASGQTADLLSIQNNGGTGLLTVNASGNVGIGTTSPNSPLQVNGRISLGASTAPSSNNTTDPLYIFTNNNQGIRLHPNGTNNTTVIGDISDATTRYAYIGYDGTNDRLQINAVEAGSSLSLTTANNERLRIDSTGNVGIGTTGPAELLEVSKSQGAATRIKITNSNAAGNAQLMLGSDSATAQIWQYGSSASTYGGANSLNIYSQSTNPIAFETNDLVRMYIKGDGNVGIGTTAPGTILHVYGATPSVKIDRASGTTNSEIKFAQGGTDMAWVGLAGANDGINTGAVSGDLNLRVNSKNILFSTDNGATANVYIKSGGNVGIGTASPGARLEIKSGGNDYATKAYILKNSDNTVLSAVTSDGRNYVGADSGTNNYLQVTRPSGSAISGLLGLYNGDGLGLSFTSGTTFFSTGIIGSTGKLAFGNTGLQSNEVVLDTATGNLGIGNTSPAAKLDITDTSLAGSGSLAGSILNMAQTWNTSGTPTAIKLNVTDTASNANSLLEDLQVGGTSKLSIRKDGLISSFNDSINNFTLGAGSSKTTLTAARGIDLITGSGWSTTLVSPSADINLQATRVAFTAGSNTAYLTTDAANVLAQRNGTNAQTFRVYNTYTDASNYERLSIGNVSNVITFASEAAGTGTARNFNFTGGNVGIGTASPSVALDVTGAGKFSTSLQAKGGVSSIADGSAGNFGQVTADTSVSAGRSELIAQVGGGVFASSFTTTNTTHTAFGETGRGTYLYFGSSTLTPKIATEGSVLRFGTGTSGTSFTEWLRLSAGNVGIGNNSPAARLDVTDTTLAGSGSLAGSILNMAQTWNTTGAPTAMKLNVTSTASDPSSLLMDLQVGGASKFSVRKDGLITVAGGVSTNSVISTGVNSYFGSAAGAATGNPAVTINTNNATRDNLVLHQIASQTANTLRVEDSSGNILSTLTPISAGNARQQFLLYNTLETTPINYERLNISNVSNVITFASEAGGTGTARNFNFTGGNVGIGTTTPVSPLTVKGPGSNLAGLTLMVGTGWVGQELRTPSNSGAYIDFTQNSTDDSGAGTPDFKGRILYNGTAVSNGFEFFTNGASAMAIDSTGKVGIGTTGPGSPLEVRGNSPGAGVGQIAVNATSAQNGYVSINADANREVGLDFLSAGVQKWELYRPASSNDLRLYDSADRVTFQAGGNVGIGMTSPDGLLTLSTGVTNIKTKIDDRSINFSRSSDGSYTESIVETPANATLTYNSRNSHYFYVNGNKGLEVWLDGSSAKTYVGTGSHPGTGGAFLSVLGNLAVGSTYSANTAPPTNGAIIEGNVGIGMNNPTAKLYVTSTGLAGNGASGAVVDSTISNSAGATLYGLQLSTNVTGTSGGGGGNVLGLNAAISQTNSSNLPTGLYSIQSVVNNTGGGTVSNGFGLRTSPAIYNTGSRISNYYGARFSSPYLGDGAGQPFGTVGNSWGVYVEALTGGDVSNTGIVIGETSGGNNTNLLVGTTTTPSGSFSIYNSSTKNNYFAGNLGLGATNPQYKLDVLGTDGTTALGIRSSDNGVLWDIVPLTSDGGGVIRGYNRSGTQTINFNNDNGNSYINTTGNVGIGTSVPDAKLEVNGSACFDTAANTHCTAAGTAGDIYYGTAHANWTDVAEKYPSVDSTLEPGDVVMLDAAEITATGKPYVMKSTETGTALGIISEHPGIVLGDDYGKSMDYSLALSGRVPVKITDENGVIKSGDRLTVSKTRVGYAMKMNESGQSLGIALQDSNGTGKILVFVNLGYQHLDIAQNSEGQIVIASGDYNMSGFSLLNVKTISSMSGKWSIGDDGTITAQKIQTHELCIDDICMTRDELKEFLDSRHQGSAGSVQAPVETGNTIETEKQVETKPQETPVVSGDSTSKQETPEGNTVETEKKDEGNTVETKKQIETETPAAAAE